MQLCEPVDSRDPGDAHHHLSHLRTASSSAIQPCRLDEPEIRCADHDRSIKGVWAEQRPGLLQWKGATLKISACIARTTSSASGRRMTFGQLPAGATVFLVRLAGISLHNRPQSTAWACTRLVQQVEHRALSGFTSTTSWGDAPHRLMTHEAIAVTAALCWLAARLRKLIISRR